MAWFDDLDKFLKEYHSSRIVYNRFRIPGLPPSEDTTAQPGHLCWGQVGSLPTASPVPQMSFQTQSPEVHDEITRTTEPVRIENPTDPSQYIMVDRTKELLFQKTTQKAQGNIYEEIPPGISSYENLSPNFVPADAPGKTTIRVNFHGPGNVAGSTGPGNIVPGPFPPII